MGPSVNPPALARDIFLVSRAVSLQTGFVLVIKRRQIEHWKTNLYCQLGNPLRMSLSPSRAGGGGGGHVTASVFPAAAFGGAAPRQAGRRAASARGQHPPPFRGGEVSRPPG